jgi:hypothetical protein
MLKEASRWLYKNGAGYRTDMHSIFVRDDGVMERRKVAAAVEIPESSSA